MRIRNNEGFNTSIYAQHTGNGVPEYLNLPSGATVELDDDIWTAKFANGAVAQIENGSLEITKAVALTEEEVEAIRVANLKAAEKLIADSKKAAK